MAADSTAADEHLPHLTQQQTHEARRLGIALLRGGQSSFVDGVASAMNRLGIADLTNHQIRQEERNNRRYCDRYGHDQLKRGVSLLMSEQDFVDTMNGTLCFWCGRPARGSVERILNTLPYLSGTCASACNLCQFFRGSSTPSAFLERAERISIFWPDEELPLLGSLPPTAEKFTGSHEGMTEENWEEYVEENYGADALANIHAAYKRIGRYNRVPNELTKYEYARLMLGVCYCCGTELLPLLAEQDGYCIDQYVPNGGYNPTNAYGCCGGLGDVPGCNHMMGPRHPKTFIITLRLVYNNLSLTDNGDVISEIEGRLGGWLPREVQQAATIATSRLNPNSLHTGALRLASSLGSRGQAECEAYLQGARDASEADKTHRITLPNQSEIVIRPTVFTSGFIVDGHDLLMGHGVFSTDDISNMIATINRYNLYDDVDPDTRRVAFTAANSREIRDKLASDYDRHFLLGKVYELLTRDTVSTSNLPLVMGDDGTIALRQGYQYRSQKYVNLTQQRLIIESLEIGAAGPWSIDEGHAFILQRDPTFPLTRGEYKSLVSDRMARIRRLDLDEYNRLRDLATFIQCGRMVPFVCGLLFRGGHGSLGSGPKRCKCLNSPNVTHSVVATPPICRMHFSKQNFFSTYFDKNISKTECTCPGQQDADE